MKLFLPFRGEFGHKVLRHVPHVNGCSEPKAVCCELGEEALYPGAAEYHPVERIDDAHRHEHMDKRDAEFIATVAERFGDGYEIARLGKYKRTPFVPTPHVLQHIHCDVVLCPRRRSYGSNKNWPHWEALHAALSDEFDLFAAGAPDSSFELPGCASAWHHDRYLDATLEAMLSAKIVVATDAGLAHLALLCGVPLLLISHENARTAPYGYRQIDLKRLSRGNHCRVPVRIVTHAWEGPERIVEALRDPDSFECQSEPSDPAITYLR